MDSAGDLFIADSGNNVIREVPFTTQAAVALNVHIGDIVTVVGNGTAGYSGDGPTAAATALLNFPVGIAFDSSEDLFIADSGNNVIREVTPGESTPSPTAPSRPTRASTTTAWAATAATATAPTAAQLNGPEGIAFDSAGDLFIADSNNNRVREIIRRRHQHRRGQRHRRLQRQWTRGHRRRVERPNRRRGRRARARCSSRTPATT